MIRDIQATNDMVVEHLFCYLTGMISKLRSLLYKLVSRRTLALRHQSHSVVINGRESVLQEKTWRVLRLLQRRAPEVVSRQEIIDRVWSGNWFTGEKGLNQAIWNLRKALNDSAQAPAYIRTMPRLGYRWIYPARRARSLNYRSGGVVLAGFFALTGLTTGVTLMALNKAETMAVPATKSIEQPVAAATYLSGDAVVIRLESGCQGIIRPSKGKVFGRPVLSENGYHVAFTVHEAASCKTVTWSVADKNFEKFDFCPIPTEESNSILET